MRQPRPNIQRQVDHALSSLSQEFAGEVAAESIWHAGRARLGEIVAQARFDEFLPVLVYGDVRERILGRLAGQVATAHRHRGDSDPERGVRELIGFEVEALDGGVGTIDGATRVADASLLVVDTGRSIFAKTVLLPVADVMRVDVDEEKVFVKRTKDEIKHPSRFDYIGDPDTN